MQRKIAMRRLSEPKAQSTINVVHPAELSDETQQTSGSLRMSAIAATHGIVSSQTRQDSPCRALECDSRTRGEGTQDRAHCLRAEPLQLRRSGIRLHRRLLRAQQYCFPSVGSARSSEGGTRRYQETCKLS